MATETKKSRKKAKNEEGGGFFSGVTTYLSEVRTEINKVSWPQRDDVIRLTWIVLLTTIISSLALGALSFAYAEFIKIGIDNSILFVGLFVIAIGATAYIFRRSNQKVSY